MPRPRTLGFVVLWDGVPAEFDNVGGGLFRGAAVASYRDFRKVSYGGTLFPTLSLARQACSVTYLERNQQDPGNDLVLQISRVFVYRESPRSNTLAANGRAG